MITNMLFAEVGFPRDEGILPLHFGVRTHYIQAERGQDGLATQGWDALATEGRFLGRGLKGPLRRLAAMT